MAEAEKLTAKELMDSVTPITVADRLAMAQCILLQAVVSSLLAENAKGSTAPGGGQRRS